MKKADLNLLVIFDAIMREGSMTRAAEQLAMTQPAVSNAVSRMRVAWNDPVFIKQGRGIMPTPYAQTMWAQAQPHLDELRHMANPEPFDATSARRTFRIGAADFNLGQLWRRLRRRAEQDAHGIDFHAVPIAKASIQEQLVDADVDACLAPVPKQLEAHIRYDELLHSYFVCAMRNDHALAATSLTLDAFVAAEHLMVSLSGDATGIIDEQLHSRGLNRRVAMTVNHFSLVPTLLADSNLISTVPYEIVADAARRGELHITRPPINIAPVTMSLLWHERNARDGGHRWLREQLKTAARETRQALPIPSCVDFAPVSPTDESANTPYLDMPVSS